MKINTDNAFNLLGIVFVVVLIGALMLAGAAGLSMTGIIITGVVVAAIGHFVAIILQAKYSSEQNEPADVFHLDEVKVPRTALDTGIEVLTGVLVAAAWAVSARNGLFTANDGGFSFRTLFKLLMITSFIFFMHWDTYTPSEMYHVGKLTNLKQVALARLMYRSIAILIAVGMLFSSFPTLHGLLWLWIVLAAIMVIIFLSFRILIRKARD